MNGNIEEGFRSNKHTGPRLINALFQQPDAVAQINGTSNRTLIQYHALRGESPAFKEAAIMFNDYESDIGFMYGAHIELENAGINPGSINSS